MSLSSTDSSEETSRESMVFSNTSSDDDSSEDSCNQNLSNLPGPGLNNAFESTTGRTSDETIKARESDAMNFVEF